MRNFILGLVLILALCVMAQAQEADQEIVSGFLGGNSCPPVAGDAVSPAEPRQSPARSARSSAHRLRTPKKQLRRPAAIRKIAGPLPLPVQIARPVPAAPAASTRSGIAPDFANVQWTHPVAVGAGLIPVALGILLTGVRAVRHRNFVRRRTGLPEFPEDKSPTANPPQKELRPDPPSGSRNSETELARRHGTGKGEIRLARMIGRKPDARIRKMQQLVASPEQSAGDTGIARDLRVGTGEVRLAMRLHQLSGSDNNRRVAQ